MRAEAEVPSAERYLVVRDRITRFPPAYRRFAQLLMSAAWVSGSIDYCYADLALPKAYDYVFDVRNPARHWQQLSTVRYAFHFQRLVDTLPHGHAAHCLLEFPDATPPPDIFTELPVNNGGLIMHPGIGLCRAADWPAICRKLLRSE